MEERLRQILETAFPGAKINLERIPGSERMSGYIAWDGFEDWEQMDRQEAIWKALREHLGAGAPGVSIILSYTPREMELMRAA